MGLISKMFGHEKPQPNKPTVSHSKNSSSKGGNSYDRKKRFFELTGGPQQQNALGQIIKKPGTVSPSEAISIMDREEQEFHQKRASTPVYTPSPKQSKQRGSGSGSGALDFLTNMGTNLNRNMDAQTGIFGGGFGFGGSSKRGSHGGGFDIAEAYMGQGYGTVKKPAKRKNKKPKKSITIHLK